MLHDYLELSGIFTGYLEYGFLMTICDFQWILHVYWELLLILNAYLENEFLMILWNIDS